MLTRTAQIALGTLTNYLRFAVTVCVFFLLTPLMIRQLGMAEFGLWALVFSVLGFFSLLDLGFGTAAVKYIAQCHGSDDVQSRDTIVSTLAAVYVCLAIVAAAGIGVLTPHFNGLFSVPADRAGRAIAVLWILAIRTVLLGLPLSLFRHILFGRQKVYLINAVQCIMTAVYGVAAWLALSRGMGIVTLAWLNLGAMLVEHVAYIALVLLTGGVRVSVRLISGSMFRRLSSLSVFACLANVAGLILLRADPIVIKIFLSLSAVAIYAVALKMAEYAHVLVKQFISVLSPMVAQMSGRGEAEKIRFVLVNCTRFALVPAGIVAVCVYVLGKRAVVLWVGAEFAPAGTVLVILITAILLSVPQMTASTVLTMTGHHKLTGSAAVVSMAINVAASVAMVRWLGIVGVAMGTLIATVIVDVFVIVPLACRLHEVAAWSYVRRVLPAVVVPGAVHLAITATLAHFWPPVSLGVVALEVLPGTAAYLAVFWWLFVEDSEKRLLADKLIRFRAGPAQQTEEATLT